MWRDSKKKKKKKILMWNVLKNEYVKIEKVSYYPKIEEIFFMH